MKLYQLKEYKPPTRPPKSLEEMAARLMLLEEMVFKTKGKPSDLRKRVENIEAHLNDKGLLDE